MRAMPHASAQAVRITDVSPRDGLQNEAGVIPTADKVRLVELLRKTGVDEIEVTSFVSARWVPQLGDAAEVFSGISPAGQSSAVQAPHPNSRALLSALVPNEKGLEAALAVNTAAGRSLLTKVSVFTAASESFSRRNTNATIAETLERFKPVVDRARSAGLAVRGYVSCAIACPFEGPIEPTKVLDVARRLVEIGVDELDYGDTIGAGTPALIADLLAMHAAELGHGWMTRDRFTLHLHDTFGHAADCVREALSRGVRSFDGSVAGLGGCPYAGTPEKRAPGNISTELLVQTVHSQGFTTGVDTAALDTAAMFARSIVATSRRGAATNHYEREGGASPA